MPESRDFSVIIPTHDRPGPLTACLEALAAQDYPPERFEVIVVDDAGREPLEAVVEPLRSRLHLTLLRQEHAGPGVARNHGAAHATGRFLAFTDDDCAPAPDWLRKLRDALDETPASLVGGRVINALRDNLYSTACQTLIDASYAYYDPAQGRAHFFPSNNFAMAADQFRAVGGFDPGWALAAGEDREFCHRWLRSGSPLKAAPGAVIHHQHAHRFASFCELHFRYGRGAFHYHRARARSAGSGPERPRAGGLQPAWAFYGACLLHPFGRVPPVRAVAITVLFVISQAANAAGYFWERARAGRKG